jgi:transposase-like protein
MGQRSSNPKLFKTQIVQERLQLDATISGVAVTDGFSAT